MARATKSTKSPGKEQPPAQGQAKANATTPTTPEPAAKMAGQPASKPPAKETVITNGVIQRFEDGRLVSTTTSKPQAKGKAKAPRRGDTVQIGELDGERLFEFTPLDRDNPHSRVEVVHYQGFKELSRTVRFAHGYAAHVGGD